MKLNKYARAAVILLILALNIGCDQVTKSLVRKHIYLYSHWGYIHDHVVFTRVENTGAFLSLGDSISGWEKIVFLNVLPLLAVLFGLVYIIVKTKMDQLIVFAIILIIGGGFGNIYDRLRYGSVTDFMHINFVIFQTGVFNVADMSIMAGTFIILLHSWFKKKPEVKVTGPDEKPVQG
jgi:signal peptidase II